MGLSPCTPEPPLLSLASGSRPFLHSALAAVFSGPRAKGDTRRGGHGPPPVAHCLHPPGTGDPTCRHLCSGARLGPGSGWATGLRCIVCRRPPGAASSGQSWPLPGPETLGQVLAGTREDGRHTGVLLNTTLPCAESEGDCGVRAGAREAPRTPVGSEIHPGEGAACCQGSVSSAQAPVAK